MTLDDLRAVARWAADCAERAFADGGPRTKSLRTAAWAAASSNVRTAS